MSPPRFFPPKGFRPSDLVSWAEFHPGPNFAQEAPRLKGAARRGINYERNVHRHLGQYFSPERQGPLYISGRWIAFRTRLGPEWRWAQPDGLLIDYANNLIVIIEIKLSHTQNAWWGLRRLYEPLIRFIFGDQWNYAVCEVTRWYDPAVAWPEKYTFIRDPSMLRRNEFGVMMLTDRHMTDFASFDAVAFAGFRPSNLGT